MSSLQRKSLNDYWTLIWNLFDPFTPLVGLELEPCYVERENSPVAELIFALQPDRIPQKVLFTGQRGSGKTSALVRLARSLSQDYLVIWIDLQSSLDTYRTSILDLLLAVGGGVYKVARGEELEPAPESWREMINALNTFLAQTSGVSARRTEAGGAEPAFSPYPPVYQLDAEDFLKSMVCARSDPSAPLALEPPKTLPMRLELDKFESLRVGPVLREMVERVNAIVADVEARAGYSLLVIVDGLDKLPRVLAENIFAYASALVDIRCRTAFALPYSVYIATGYVKRDYFDIYELPNVNLYLRGQRQERYKPGFDVMRQVVGARLNALGLDTKSVITSEALDKLIWGSGGVMRGLMWLVRDATLEAQLAEKMTIGSTHADAALEADRRTRYTILSPDKVAYLCDFEATGQWQHENLFLEQLEGRNIVAYTDRKGTWYSVHPSILPLLEN